MASWDSIPEAEKPFQRRLMEVFAGFTEHADYNAGRVIDEIERQGKLDNTLIFYIWGDNGSICRRTERHHQRKACAERHSEQDRAAVRRLEGTRRARCARDRQRPTTCIMPDGPGPAARRSIDQAGRRTFRRHPPTDGGLVAEGHQGRHDAARAIPSRHRHRADDLRAARDHAAATSSTASSRIRSTA